MGAKSAATETIAYMFRMCPTHTVSSENTIIAVAIAVGVCSLVVLGIIETVVGLPGQWGFVVAFFLLVLFGAFLPQVYLLKTDQSVSSASRLGVVTLVLIILAAGFSGEVTGRELTAIWVLVGISIGLIVITEGLEGYRQSARSE